MNQRKADSDSLREAILEKLYYGAGKPPASATPKDWYAATSLVIRDHIVDRWISGACRTTSEHRKQVYYFSMEFLIGRLLADALSSLRLTEATREALLDLGQDLDRIVAQEPDPALGNGGLGRLAACFLDSMTSLGIPAYGYGIRYEHGLFRQTIADGRQVEEPEDWLIYGHPWEFERREVCYRIGFGGSVGQGAGDSRAWTPAEEVAAVASDTPIAGWGGQNVNVLRLWKAKALQMMDLERFNCGHHVEAMAEAVRAESLSRVLYPGDETDEGKELRLKQEYFFTAASIKDLLLQFESEFRDLTRLPDHVAIQLNDTHPAIAVAELVRLLVDEHRLDFRTAFGVTRSTITYTNHTLLPEALERWPIETFRRILPRHYEIVAEIDALVRSEFDHNGAEEPLEALQIVDVRDNVVRMGQLAFVGSHRVNGVSRLHTDLMKTTVFRELNAFYPGRIINETNGITPRRWLYQCNPSLRDLLTETIGPLWVGDLEDIERTESFISDSSFRGKFAAARLANKQRLAAWIGDKLDIAIDPEALFDIHVKRIHEYKRQLLNLLETLSRYLAIRREPNREWTQRVKIFAGKAAPSYTMAKLIIRLANDIARTVNNDRSIGDRLRVVFVPDYNVSMAQLLVPAADLSEQISTAGMEASGTGNMKFALNGALTIGTLDGANVEMAERFGDGNIFIFGLSANEVAARRAAGWSGSSAMTADGPLAEAVGALESGLLSRDDPDRYRAIVDQLRGADRFMVAADFAAYADSQARIDRAFRDRESWTTRSILNVARSGWFSSDRTIRGYAQDVWSLGRIGLIDERI